MENEFEKGSTYVLFGSEAIQMYQASVKLLLSSIDISYKVGSYTDVKEFVKESKNWDGFLEINEKDYYELKKNTSNLTKTEIPKLKRNKRFSLSKFFK